MKKTIAVIIPFFNSEKTLSTMLDSILAGVTIPSEILLIDDGSTDSSPDIAKKYASEQPFIKYIHQDHTGVSAARNNGIALANSEGISFLDADDYIEPDMYKLMSDALADDSYSGCICGYFTHKDGIVTPYCNSSKSPMTSNEIIEFMFTDDNIRGFLFTRLFRASIVKKYSFNTEISMCEDLLFQSQLFSGSDLKFAYVNKPLYHYIQNSSSATASLNYFKDDVFIYKPAFDKMSSIIDKAYVSTSYNSILQFSMYSLLKTYNLSGHDEVLKKQIRRMQQELRSTPCVNKSWRRIMYQAAPFLYSLLFI